jgi:hypothetical protein
MPKGGWPKKETTVETPKVIPIKEKAKETYAFAMEHEGKALYGVTMYTIIDGKVVDSAKVDSGQFARTAVMQMGRKAMQIVLNGQKPDTVKRNEVRPTR